jgi:4'-phosphopantetheinyl transferase
MDTEIYFAEISDITFSGADKKLLGLVSKSKQDKIKRYKFDIDKRLGLYAELMVRIYACKQMGIKNSEIEISQCEYGKPYLASHPQFHFNLSHTRNAVAVIMSDGEAGVDVEKIKPFDRQVAKRFFHSDEQEYIFAHGQFDFAAYEIWTKKEAYIKQDGLGLSMPLTSFSVLSGGADKTLETHIHNDYLISSCTAAEKPPVSFNFLSEHYLQEMGMALL